MRILFLEAGEDLREQIGADHGGNTDFNRALLQLFVIVDLEHRVLDIAQGELDAIEEHSALRCKCQLLLAAVKQLYAEFGFQLLDCHGDIRLGHAQAFGGSGDVLQPAGHLKIFELS